MITITREEAQNLLPILPDAEVELKIRKAAVDRNFTYLNLSKEQHDNLIQNGFTVIHLDNEYKILW